MSKSKKKTMTTSELFEELGMSDTDKSMLCQFVAAALSCTSKHDPPAVRAKVAVIIAMHACSEVAGVCENAEKMPNLGWRKLIAKRMKEG